jgi:hypothetical protein
MLGREDSQEPEAPEAVTERIRHAMLSTLGEYFTEDMRPLVRQILQAWDVEGLWYLRPEIMRVIADSRGEALARECLVQMTALFQGHHPGATPSRFASL